MNLDIYHITQGFLHTHFMSPIMLDVLQLWSNELGHHTTTRTCSARHINYNSDADLMVFCVYTSAAPDRGAGRNARGCECAASGERRGTTRD